MTKGDILIATDPCTMDDETTETLTVGKEYKIISTTNETFKIIDDEGDEHGFDIKSYREFFIIKMVDYDKMIAIMKDDIWKRITLLPEEKTSRVVEMQERTIFNEGDNYRFIIKEKELYDKIFKERISYTDMSIEDLNYLLEQWEQEIQ